MKIKRVWYDDPSCVINYEYKRKYSYWPIKLDNKIIVFRYYYKKYLLVSYDRAFHDYDHHCAYVESITENEYICRKLAGNLDR
jgi:hypothetical protein